MAITVTGFTSNTLPYKLVMEDGTNQNSAVSFNGNVTGTSGSLFSINVVNNNNKNYLKIWVGSSAAYSDDPDLKIEILASQTEEIIIPSGLPFTELSFMVTQTSASGNSQTAPGNSALVKLVTS